MVQSYNFLTYYTILVLALLTLKKEQWCKAVGFSIVALYAFVLNRIYGCVNMAVYFSVSVSFYFLKIYTFGGVRAYRT